MPICHQILFHVRCRLGLELIGYRVVEKVYERFPLLRAANPLLFHKDHESLGPLRDYAHSPQGFQVWSPLFFRPSLQETESSFQRRALRLKKWYLGGWIRCDSYELVALPEKLPPARMENPPLEDRFPIET